MAFLRVNSSSTQRVGGRVLVRNYAPDLTTATAQIWFSRKFGAAPEYIFTADISDVKQDLVNKRAECTATCRVGPEVSRVFTGKWYMQVKVVLNVGGKEIPAMAADAIDFYGSGLTSVTGPAPGYPSGGSGGSAFTIVDNGDGTVSIQGPSDNGDGTVSF